MRYKAEYIWNVWCRQSLVFHEVAGVDFLGEIYWRSRPIAKVRSGS